jgi:hypothetical protein
MRVKGEVDDVTAVPVAEVQCREGVRRGLRRMRYRKRESKSTTTLNNKSDAKF